MTGAAAAPLSTVRSRWTHTFGSSRAPPSPRRAGWIFGSLRFWFFGEWVETGGVATQDFSSRVLKSHRKPRSSRNSQIRFPSRAVETWDRFLVRVGGGRCCAAPRTRSRCAVASRSATSDRAPCSSCNSTRSRGATSTRTSALVGKKTQVDLLES